MNKKKTTIAIRVVCLVMALLMIAGALYYILLPLI